MNLNVLKIKPPTSLVRFFWYFTKRHPVILVIITLAPFSIVINSNIIPYALKMFIDAIINYKGDKANIAKDIMPAVWVGGISWATLVLISWTQSCIQAVTIPKFVADIRMSVINYLMLHSYSYFSNQLAGDISNKIIDLPRAIESIYTVLCSNIVPTFVVVLTTLGIMLSINQAFAWIMSIWVSTHLVINLYFIGLINKLSKENAQDRSILSGSIVDMISNIVSVKLFVNYSKELIYIGNKQEKEKESNTILTSTINTFQRYLDIAATIMLIGSVFFLIKSWQQEIITIGEFVLILNIIFAIMSQIYQIGYGLVNLFRGIGVAQQALALIISPYNITNNKGAKPIRVTRGEIVFDNVTFYYDEGNNLFENKSLVLKAGQKVGLVGLSGSGKSTFANLILRFFDIKSGTIKIDGQDIAQVTQNSLHSSISIIPQDPLLFHRTIMENIRYGKITSSDEEVIEAAKKAHCHDFIVQLPNGYMSMVGERGVKLSVGQRQRIVIARAILKQAPILILDEATSALDSITEKYIQKSLHDLMQGNTSLIIAHRLSTISAMDRILVFNKGTIIEDGTHEELINANGLYSHMCGLQKSILEDTVNLT